MATLMMMENVEVLEDATGLLPKTVKLNENYLWCEPLLNEQEVADIRAHLVKLNIPFVVARFDTELELPGPDWRFDEDRLPDKRYAKVIGMFVRRSDLGEYYE